MSKDKYHNTNDWNLEKNSSRAEVHPKDGKIIDRTKLDAQKNKTKNQLKDNLKK